MSKVHVFVSFDIQHDEDLYEVLLAQSRTPSSGFAVLGGSPPSAADWLVALGFAAFLLTYVAGIGLGLCSRDHTHTQDTVHYYQVLLTHVWFSFP